jgi:dipeptidyl aminopeptidase/acylaminoacyl peptidase
MLSPNAEERAIAVAKADRAILENVSLSVDDGVVLQAWHIRPIRGNGDAVILLHGQADNRGGMLGLADVLLRRGYTVLLPDARAQGTSGGELATYGVKEANDIHHWFSWLDQREKPHCVDGLGESMGAAQLLQSLNAEPRFCAVVAESPFANFREASYDRMGQQIGAGAWAGRAILRPVVEAGLLYARWKYGVDLSQATPDKTVAGSQVPVLLIHGLKDNNLPPRHSEMILAQSRGHNAHVVLWELPEAGHCGGFATEPQDYERRLLGWFDINDQPKHY